MEPASQTYDAIRDLESLITVTKLKSLLGFCNVIRLFIHKFARVVAPLNEKPQENQSARFRQLTKEETAAMDALQEKLVLPPVLPLLRYSGKNTPDTDDCNV